MRRLLTTAAAVAVCTLGLTLETQAQKTETKTKIETEHAKNVTFTGCVQTGTQARTFVLQNVVPVRTTETTSAGGTTTTTTYELVPEGTVELQQQVGHKVEVTGIVIAAGHGEAKVKTRTKTNGVEEKSEQEFDRGATPQVKVISMRQLADRC